MCETPAPASIVGLSLGLCGSAVCASNERAMVLTFCVKPAAIAAYHSASQGEFPMTLTILGYVVLVIIVAFAIRFFMKRG